MISRRIEDFVDTFNSFVVLWKGRERKLPTWLTDFQFFCSFIAQFFGVRFCYCIVMVVMVLFKFNCSILFMG